MKSSFLGASINTRAEVGMLILTSLQAFFIGTFFSLFYTGSHILFLQSFSIEEFPHALVISGVIGTIFFSLYTYFSNRTSLRFLVLFNMLIIFAITVLLFTYFDRISLFKIMDLPLFFPLSLVFPVSFLIILIFRRSIGQIYSPNQFKRFYPITQVAFMGGIIVSSYGLVGALFFSWDMLYIIKASAASMAVTILLQLIINMYQKLSGSFYHVARKPGVLRSKFYEFFYSRYTLLLVIFIIISSIIGFILHFYFVSEIRISYPNTIGLAKFFGFFMGTMFLFVLFLERYLIRRILYTYDSPYSTIILPMIMILGFIASLLVDLLVGRSAAIASISFGFLMVVILRIGYEATFQAIELPSLRVLFRTLDLRFTSAVIPRIEGSFRMFALLLAGIILSALLLIKLRIHLTINILLIILSVIWLPVTVKLIKSYQNALRETIRKLKTSKRTIEQKLLTTDEKTHELINSDAYNTVIHTLSLIEKLEPLRYEMHMISLLGTSSLEIRKYLLDEIEKTSFLAILPRLKEISNQNNNRQFSSHVSRLIRRFEIKLSVGVSKESIEKLVNSDNIPDRVLAAEIIGASLNPDLTELLSILSRDIEPDVKFAAIKSMSRLAHPDHSYILIGYLSTPAYYPYAFDALIRIGDPALPHLEHTFLLPDADNTLLSRIVRIYGKIGTAAAIELLLGKLENQNRIIMHQTLLALRESKFQATPGNINRILNDIVRLINIMSWNFAAYTSLGNNKRFILLQDALESEIHENYNSLYHLLALAYNPTSVGNIKNLLTEGNDVDISFAIELLDQIVNEDIKQVFLPVVENISHKERFKQLQYFFHSEKLDPNELINEIITRDFNSLSLYVKACAIFNLLILQKKSVSQELIASMFHPDKLLRESAAYVISQMKPEYLEEVYPRLDPGIVNETKQILSYSSNGFPYLLLDRIRFLRECPRMRGISEEVLLEIVKHLEIGFLNAGDEFLIKSNDVHYAFMIIFEGNAEIRISDDKVVSFGKNDIIYSDIFIEDSTFSLKAVSDLKLYSLDQEILNSLMFDHIEFRNSILNLIEEA